MRISLVLGGLVLLAFVPVLRSQDGKPAAPAAPGTPGAQDPAALAIAAAAEPAEQHKALARFEGDWVVRGKMFMDPSAPPTDVKGRSEFKVLFDGRYLREKYDSTFLGKPFEGLGIIGYDKQKKAYVANWVDTISTGFELAEGVPSADANVLEMKGTAADEVSGELVAFRWVRKWNDADSFVFSSFECRAGKPEALTMELTYKRKVVKPVDKKSDKDKKKP